MPNMKLGASCAKELSETKTSDQPIALPSDNLACTEAGVRVSPLGLAGSDVPSRSADVAANQFVAGGKACRYSLTLRDEVAAEYELVMHLRKGPLARRQTRI